MGKVVEYVFGPTVKGPTAGNNQGLFDPRKMPAASDQRVRALSAKHGCQRRTRGNHTPWLGRPGAVQRMRGRVLLGSASFLSRRAGRLAIALGAMRSQNRTTGLKASFTVILGSSRPVEARGLGACLQRCRHLK